MPKKSQIISSTLIAFLLLSCGRSQSHHSHATEAASDAPPSIDQAAVTAQLGDYLQKQWLTEGKYCGGVYVPTGIAIHDQRSDANGDLEIQADVTFVVTNPGSNSSDLNFGGRDLAWQQNELQAFNGVCLFGLRRVFNLSSDYGTLIQGLHFGDNIIAHGVTIKLAKWSSGLKVSDFKFE